FAGHVLIDGLDIGAIAQQTATLLIHHVQDARALRLPQAQIFVAARSQSMQMTQQPVPGARIVAVAFPDNGNGGHGFFVPRKAMEPRRAHLARAYRRAQAMFGKRVASKFTHAPFWLAPFTVRVSDSCDRKTIKAPWREPGDQKRTR